ncbi:MAG TPA: CotH kinase family protein [Polyangia bacterium]
MLRLAYAVRRGFSCAGFALLGAALVACGHNTGEEPPTEPVIWNPPGDHPSPKSTTIYDESKVVDFHVSFPPGQFETLIGSREKPELRWVDCSLTFEGESFPNAACRRKGNTFSWDSERKPQFVVRFNLKDPKGRFRGLRRLNFESFDGAKAPMRDRLGMWLMREAGIDASRVNHARVFKDGALLGVYMNVEAVDKEFLEDHFAAEATGNLWEDGELKTNEDVNDRTRLVALQNLVRDEPLEGDHTAFFTQLDALVDVSQILREMAAETALIAADNFSNGSPRNFFYYEHPTRGFQVLPWDLDSIFLSPLDSDPFEFWANQRPNKLRQLMNQNPTWRAEYIAALVDIRDRILTRAPARLAAICAQIAPVLREDVNRVSTYEDYQSDCATLGLQIQQRITSLRTLLGR